MASGQNPQAKVILYAKSSTGDRYKVFSGVNEQTGPGGSPDGVQATTKNNELPIMPMSNRVLAGGTKIIPVVVLTVSDGVDASDCVFNVPVREKDGSIKMLSAADLGITTDLPASSPISQELDLGTGYELSNSETLVVGGAPYFISVENDTA